MKNPTYDQIAAALYAYDAVIGNETPDLAKRVAAMRAALTVVLTSDEANTPPLDIAVSLFPPKE